MNSHNLTYVYHALQTRPRSWAQVAAALQGAVSTHLADHAGQLYGIFRSQIGRPRDELSVITAWPSGRSLDGEHAFFSSAGDDVVCADSQAMHPTLRPVEFMPPTRQGNFAFRWFETPIEHFAEFSQLCEGAWPDFESSYDSQVLGLWRLQSQDPTHVKTLLLTRRPDLAMWERSKIPSSETEREVRRKLTRRYDLCEATWVFTTTLLTASDKNDDVNWS